MALASSASCQDQILAEMRVCGSCGDVRHGAGASLTEAEMTSTFADELAGLADSLTPGGILLILGSQAANYDAIFDELSSLITRSGKVRPLFRLDRVAAHPDPRVHDVVSNQIVACLQHVN